MNPLDAITNKIEEIETHVTHTVLVAIVKLVVKAANAWLAENDTEGK